MLDTSAPIAAAAPQTKSFSGSYLLFRKAGTHLKRAGGQSRPPRFRHPTFAAAEAEAHRLLAALPDSTFIILQEVARVKLKTLDPETATCLGNGQAFAIGGKGIGA